MNEKVEEPQEQAADRPSIPEGQLKEILEAHRKWVESEGKEGERADLGGANLQGANLYEANLQGADLSQADLQGAYLDRANLQEANLYEANLQEANLRGAMLQKANLQGATLDGAKALIASEVKIARNWELAFYSIDFLKELGLPRYHDERVKKKLAELEKEKKASGAKP